MVVLPVDANGNPLIWLIASITLEYFRHVSQALIFPSFTSRNHHAFSPPYQYKVTTLLIALYSMIILNEPPTVNKYMVFYQYSDTNIFFLILGVAYYSLYLFLHIYFNHNFLFTTCSIYSRKFSLAPTLDLSLYIPPQPLHAQLQQNNYPCTSLHNLSCTSPPL